MGPEGYAAAFISGGAIITAAIIKLVPRNGHCQSHSGIVQWMVSIDKRLDEIHTDVKALK